MRVRHARRTAQHLPPQGVPRRRRRAARLPDHLLLHRKGLPPPGCLVDRARRCAGADRGGGRRCRRGVPARHPGQEGLRLVPVQRHPQPVRGRGLHLPATQGQEQLRHVDHDRTSQAPPTTVGLARIAARAIRSRAHTVAAVCRPGRCSAVLVRIAAAPVVNFDETGLRVESRLHWPRSASTGKFSLLHVHRRRGREAMLAAGVLHSFTGVAVHDARAPYHTFTDATHVLCGAHLLRELQAVIDNTDPVGWCWARQVTDSLLRIKPTPRPPTPPAGSRAAPSWPSTPGRSTTRRRSPPSPPATSPPNSGPSPGASATGSPPTSRSRPARISRSITTPRKGKSAW